MINQQHGRAKVASQEYHEITIDIVISQTSVSGRRPGLEVGSPAEAPIHVQDAGLPRQIRLPACLARHKPGNWELGMSVSRLLGLRWIESSSSWA